MLLLAALPFLARFAMAIIAKLTKPWQLLKESSPTCANRTIIFAEILCRNAKYFRLLKQYISGVNYTGVFWEGGRFQRWL